MCYVSDSDMQCLVYSAVDVVLFACLTGAKKEYWTWGAFWYPTWFYGITYYTLSMEGMLVTVTICYPCKCLLLIALIRSTLYRYYLVLCERQADAQDSMALGFKAKVSYHLFRSAWLHYVSLLDLQMDSAFYCPDEHCGSAPQVMICDATALAFRQQYDCWKDLLHDQQGRACGSTAAVEGR